MPIELLRFSTEKPGDAQQLLERLAWAWSDTDIDLLDLAMAYTADNGKVKLFYTGDVGLDRAGLRGGGIGLLVGLVTSPTLIPEPRGAGNKTGVLLAQIADKGIDRVLEREIAGPLRRGEWLVIALGRATQIDRIAKLSGRPAISIPLPVDEQAAIQELAKTTR